MTDVDINCSLFLPALSCVVSHGCIDITNPLTCQLCPGVDPMCSMRALVAMEMLNDL